MAINQLFTHRLFPIGHMTHNPHLNCLIFTLDVNLIDGLEVEKNLCPLDNTTNKNKNYRSILIISFPYKRNINKI